MTTPEEIVLVLCNCPDEACASKLARGLVESGLAACVNRQAVTSVYAWQGQIEEAGEITLQIKTRRNNWPALCEWLRERHPYQVPEIIALPVCEGLSSYLDWVAQESTKASQ
jgi:periplasmic divalent cation tolerance protein